MLTLVDIKKKDACNYIVILNRDGKEMVYEYHVHIPGPNDPNGIRAMGHSEEMDYDLIDYELPCPPDRPHGAIYIPFMRRISNLVFRVADGIPVDLPVVLDER